MASQNNKPHYLVFFCIVFLSFTLSTSAQVGIGTTEPEAMLHVKGDYVAPVTGENTILDENFNSTTIGQYPNQIVNSRTSSCPPNAWVVTNSPYDRTGCSACTGRMLNISSDEYDCILDATAFVPFTTTGTSISISFDYKIFRGTYNNGNGRLIFLLHNEDDTTEITLQTVETNTNTSFTTTLGVVPGTNYSLRFRYTGEWDYGATVDNIKITEEAVSAPGAYAFKLEDGTQGPGYVLVSDADGNASWQPVSALRPVSNDSSGISLNTGSSEEIRKNLELLSNLKNIVREREIVLETENERIQTLQETVNSSNLKNKP
ncbi:hypothetical protein EI546_13910 [Aequorivita sp. H23M31]|uniref:Uncharacterized protein n=1 Tax=Aequorivita ciconiae TaxID=2494375 RepID=A0A410G645_9FLAO|nr:hypothetical protein [Aequorivita sp. H23M31]QAA82747.1 hypothetical protein EI546_13910 [Aequorivita sp. H23M31]